MMWLYRSVDGGRKWTRYKRLPAATAELVARILPHIYQMRGR